VELRVDGRRAYRGTTCLLSFYVSRHMGGRLSYPAPTEAGAPRMGISLLADVDVVRRLVLLGRAAKSALPGPPATHLWWASTAGCAVGQPTLLEMDGEVVQAGEVPVRLVPEVLRVCA
jgi:hypothetical protein